MQGQRFSKTLLAVQFFGAVMFGLICVGYILGLPEDTVYTGELASRVAIGFSGSVFFVSSIVMLAVAYMKK